MVKSEYAKSGVDYTVMEPFKMAMIAGRQKNFEVPEQTGRVY